MELCRNGCYFHCCFNNMNSYQTDDLEVERIRPRSRKAEIWQKLFDILDGRELGVQKADQANIQIVPKIKQGGRDMDRGKEN